MPFPAGWPPRVPSGIRSLRVYRAGTTTADFADNGILFGSAVGENPYTPLPYVPPGGERVAVAVPPNPWGGGRNVNDANPDPAVNDVSPPVVQMCARAILIKNGAALLEFSFDGINVHGTVAINSTYLYFDRYEAGIAVRGSGGTGTFSIEAW